MSLDVLRKRIDEIDRELVELLCRRAETATEIGAEKRRQQACIQDRVREDEVLERARRLNRGPLTGEDVTGVFREIIEACSRVQERSGTEARRG
jgi:chorismate mutase